MDSSVIHNIQKWTKTDILIKFLAQSGIEWADYDIARAIKETESTDFSLADVEYMRFLLTDECAQEDAKSLDYLYKEMARISDTEERKKFYHRNIRPNQESANSYKAMIARQFPDRVFYKMEG